MAVDFKNHISQFSGFVWHGNENKEGVDTFAVRGTDLLEGAMLDSSKIWWWSTGGERLLPLRTGKAFGGIVSSLVVGMGQCCVL